MQRLVSPLGSRRIFCHGGVLALRGLIGLFPGEATPSTPCMKRAPTRSLEEQRGCITCSNPHWLWSFQMVVQKASTGGTALKR